MRNLKKFLALVLAMMMALSLMVTVNAAATPTDFDDLDSATFSEAINVLSALGIVKGYADSDDFKPTQPITRAEVAALIYRIAANDAKEEQASIYKDYNRFGDVSENSWYAGVVNYCANAELVKGDGTNYGPRKNVTGYEILAMALRMLGYDQNKEFEGSGWQIRTASYARQVGLTQNIKEGTLGQYATREMVCEILFQALQADLVDYNLLQNYYPRNVLLAANDNNREAYADSIAAELLTLPLNADLMYVNYGIVGKSPYLTFDDFGRPSEAWVTDKRSDTTTCSDHDTNPGGTHGDAEKYVPNLANDESSTEQYITMKMTPVATYDNVVTECQLATEVNNDKGFDAILWLNGQMIYADNGTDGDGDMNAGDGNPNTNSGVGIPLVKEIDELHTVNAFLNSQGRTMEVYEVDEDQFVLVFIDTFLGRVVETRAKTVDTAGHEMTPAEADIAVGYWSDAGNNNAMKAVQIVTVETDEYSVGDMVLLQTPLATEKANNANQRIDTYTEMHEFPAVDDVPASAVEFTEADTGKPVVIKDKATTVSSFTVLGTKIATKGSTGGNSENIKTGIEGANGQVYWLANTYLAQEVTIGADYGPVLDAYYQEVTNNLINRTFNLFLDHNGYVVGMQETTSTNVGVVTGVDYNRAGAGKYTVSVAVTDVNGNNVELELLDHATKDFFATQTDASDYFGAAGLSAIAQEGAVGTVNSKDLDEGTLIEWTNVTKNGTQYQVISKIGTDYADAASDSIDTTANDRPIVRTGVTDTLSATHLINDDTRFLIANYKVDYSAEPDGNTGMMMLDGYKPYTGFKTIPTINSISTTDGEYVQWSKLTSNGQEYFAISAEDPDEGYTMVEQQKFTVDNSYLMLNSGTTYQFYSTYQALQNGQKVDVNVSNLNSVNTNIQKFMAGSTQVELITFTGKDAAGNVNAVAASTDKGHFNTRPVDNTHGTKGTTIATDGTYPSYKAGVLTVAANTYLTMAEDARVLIVNAANSGITEGTLSSINQYARQTDGTNYFCYELDANGYVSVLYIVD